MKKQKNVPEINKKDEIKTKGIASFFSFSYIAGAINRHS
jgi:hypothetical protein